MRTWNVRTYACWLLLAAVGIAGCQKTVDKPANSGGAAAGGAGSAAGDKISVALAKLTPEDRALAEKQKICPVSDEPLGSMDAPIKVKVGDRDVFICCEGCRDQLTSEPDKFLAKLKP